ncbi:hypothetical protein LG272_04410 [Pseudidiomarina marina]|uniref:hypothetical protein n=1 Tax=Pseudidiomarina marina TaxID=502366 RepID=UPI0038511A01
MNKSASIVERIPQLISGLLIVSVVSGSLYSVFYWKAFGINPFQYAEISLIGSSAILGLIPIAIQGLILSIMFLTVFKSGFVNSIRAFEQGEDKLISYKESLSKTDVEIETLTNEQNRLGSEFPDDLKERLLRVKIDHDSHKKECSQIEEEWEDNKRVLTELRQEYRKAFFWWSLVSLMAAIALFLAEVIFPTFNPFELLPLPILTFATLVGFLIVSEGSKSRILNKGLIIESWVVGTIILSFIIASSVAGYAKAYDVYKEEGKKFIYTDSMKREYIYLGTLGTKIMLYDPCLKSTHIKSDSSLVEFDLVKARVSNSCKG